jgi:predicted permease
MKDILPDIRYSIRGFRLTPFFTIVIVLSLALGIGANTALYSAIDALFLREISVRDPGQLIVFGWTAGPSPKAFAPRRGGIFSSNKKGGLTSQYGAKFSEFVFEKFRSDGTSLSDVAAFAGIDVDASIDGAGDEITAQLVSGNFFQTVGVIPIAGRMIVPEDDTASADPAVVISHGFWSRRFSQDPNAVGKRVLLNGTMTATIIGVLPAGFHNGRGVVPDFSIPLAFEPALAPGLLAPEQWGLGIVARMKPGVQHRQVEGNLQGVLQGIALQEAPDLTPADFPRLAAVPANQGFSAAVVDAAIGRANIRYPTLGILGGVFAIILLIVSLNVANLLIARAATRQYEIGVRLAMGATRLRLIRQLLTESVLLAVMGGAVGALFAYIGKDLLRLYLQQDVRMLLDLRIDPAVLAFCALVSILTGLLFGIAPALRATRMDVTDAVKQGGRGVRGPRVAIGRTLLVFQVAMSVVLLVGASLLLKTVGNLPSDAIGFDPGNILVFRINSAALNNDRDRYERMVDTIRALPGVLGAAASSAPLLSGSGTFDSSAPFYPRQEDGTTLKQSIRLHRIDNTFFEVLGIPLVRGRGFTREDTAGATPVAVITESLARALGSDPIGWRIKQEWETGTVDLEIVGVVGNVGISEIGNDIDGTVFVPALQGEGFPSTFEVRTAGSPMLVLPALREELRRISPDLRASSVSTEFELAQHRLDQTRYIAAAWAAFSGLALLLTSLGLYGLLSHTVARRTNEIGIRMALGARPRHVLRSVLSQIATLMVVGLTLGLGLSQLISLAIRPFLYGVSSFDPSTIMLPAVTLLVVAGAAAYLPARRATRVDPMIALRHE